MYIKSDPMVSVENVVYNKNLSLEKICDFGGSFYY